MRNFRTYYCSRSSARGAGLFRAMSTGVSGLLCSTLVLRLKEILSIVLAVALVILTAPGLAPVLCIGPGGHIAIEAANSPCCRFAIGHRVPGQPGWSGPGDPCGNCTDHSVLPAAGETPSRPAHAGIAAGFPHMALGEPAANPLPGWNASIEPLAPDVAGYPPHSQSVLLRC